MRSTLCPGFFERDTQEIIAQSGPDFCPYFCVLCGQQVVPVRKQAGGWVPRSHTVNLPKLPPLSIAAPFAKKSTLA